MSRGPVFHIPIGRDRDENGEVVLWEDRATFTPLLAAWQDMTLTHPATLAAGGCLIIGPTVIMQFHLATHTIVESPTPDGAWHPSALSDYHN